MVYESYLKYQIQIIDVDIQSNQSVLILDSLFQSGIAYQSCINVVQLYYIRTPGSRRNFYADQLFFLGRTQLGYPRQPLPLYFM